MTMTWDCKIFRNCWLKFPEHHDSFWLMDLGVPPFYIRIFLRSEECIRGTSVVFLIILLVGRGMVS